MANFEKQEFRFINEAGGEVTLTTPPLTVLGDFYLVNCILSLYFLLVTLVKNSQKTPPNIAANINELIPVPSPLTAKTVYKMKAKIRDTT